MLRTRTRPFRIASLASRAVTLATLAALALPACGKKGGAGTKSPEDVQAAAQAQADAAKKKARANSLLELANEDLGKGRYVSASKRAEEALAANPDNADAHAVLGAARWRAGDFEGSTDAYRKALAADPTHFGANLGLGRNLQAMGKHAEAIELQDKLLAKEKDQVDPMLRKLRSLYALGRADDAVDLLDHIFKFLPADDPELPVVQAYAAYLRALAGKGPLLQREGDTGSSDLALDAALGLKHSLAVVGGEPVRAIFLEIREEALVDPGLVKKLKLKSVGKVTPVGTSEARDVVILPEVAFGKLKLKNVPALVQPLGDYKGILGEVPIVLGRQAMQQLGSITFDFPGRTLTISAGGADAGSGGTAVPLLLLDLKVALAPAIPVSIDGSEHTFFVYGGGVFKSGMNVTKKHFLKSGHLPREIEDVDDPNAGLKMVYLDQVKVGDLVVKGVGGLVMVNEPPDAALGQVLQLASFELGGYLNLTLMQQWKVTYSLSEGRVVFAAP